jgi:predicted amidohydrolase YtcJ
MLSDSQVIAKSGACRRGLKTTIGFYKEDLETVLSSGPDSVEEGVELGGLKLFVDGTLGSRTALLLEPYEGGETCGMEGEPLNSLKESALLAAENGIGLCIHAIGDLAGRIALDILVEISGKREQLAARDRIEHVQLLHPDDLPRFSETGAIASIQPTHITGDRIAAEQAWGERCRYAYPLKSLIENGAKVAFGSDAPARHVNPLEAIRLAVTRDLGEGEPHKDRWYSGESVSTGEAIASHTVEGAFASGMEGSTGMIHEGFRADLVILSRDPFRSKEDLLETEVIATLVGGEEVYDEEGLFNAPT